VQHGVPRVSGVARGGKSDQAKEKERKQIESYKQLESDVRSKVSRTNLSNCMRLNMPI
jgi:geranylgeranyl transferase type-2 subunit alpha